jgi:hypothetical protein
VTPSGMTRCDKCVRDKKSCTWGERVYGRVKGKGNAKTDGVAEGGADGKKGDDKPVRKPSKSFAGFSVRILIFIL